ncbi:MAG: amidohydrolase family protein, partial [Candidatus Ratteibacteria bacterium]
NLKDEEKYSEILKKAKIKCRLVNILYSHTSITPSLKNFLEGKYKLPEYDRMLIPLIMFHLPVRNRLEVENIGSILNKEVNTLDKFLDICREIFIKMKEKGAVGMKDQSAYERIIYFDNPTKFEAEKLFNFIMKDPRNSLGWPEVKPLDDYLFHRFLEMAEELDLPVQIHTGHMAGIRNDVSKSNAIFLREVLELHKNVNFDLFHGNWPYMGEILFLAKNYPNVFLDFCWLYIIDPYYSFNFLTDALMTVPHSKIHGFGGDYGDCPEYILAHLEIAKDIISKSLTKLIEFKWININEAKKIAADILFNNPNEFFKLGFQPVLI